MVMEGDGEIITMKVNDFNKAIIINNLYHHFKVQNDLNKFLVDENWKNKIQEWQLISAIISECGELIDSINFKWWTKQEDNWNNAKIEIVDIWHFLLTYVLMKFKNENNFYKELIKQFYEGFNDQAYWEANTGNNRETCKYFIAYDIVEILSKFAKSEMYSKDIKEVFYTFGLLVKLVDFSLKEFDELYLSKAELNKQRKIKGYDKDSSKKFIDGIEDNEILFKNKKCVQLKLFEDI